MICLCLTGKTIPENLRLRQTWGDRAGAFEFRGDALLETEVEGARSFLGAIEKPLILTVRRRAEGPGEARRLSRLSRLAGFLLDSPGSLEGRFVDLEEDLPPQDWEERWLSRGGKVIRSFHDFSGTPAGLTGRVRGLPRRPGEIPKAAVWPKTGEDLLQIFRTCRELEPGPRIVLGMGALGLPTRILGRKLGALFTYASAPGYSAAPGQLDPETLEDLYGFSGLSGNPRLFALLGFPALQSLSPAIHNRGFRALGLDGVYLPLEMEDPLPFLAQAQEAGFAGFSVTHPHKEKVLPLLSFASPQVREIGACNTLIGPGCGGYRGELSSTPGGWQGHNTDAEGFSAPLAALWGREDFHGLAARIIGAGGAAGAAAWELKRRGAEVRLYNRSAPRAQALARRLDLSWGLLGDPPGANLPGGDLLVNATPAGLTGEDPVPGLSFDPGELVYDLTYREGGTPFLARAQGAGCRTLGGGPMLFAQAKLQFKLFTGREYPFPRPPWDRDAQFNS
ncbi:MAG: type I 3-dehydroquinate dehydratase [Spirochaetales bacterium]|jgi:3-dehydroquinate dehydratase/shikimate dehydrogenase|nr:type I 3-dehydroquinate dehydratase [Spirochaetales bacterium]